MPCQQSDYVIGTDTQGRLAILSGENKENVVPRNNDEESSFVNNNSGNHLIEDLKYFTLTLNKTDNITDGQKKNDTYYLDDGNSLERINTVVNYDQSELTNSNADNDDNNDKDDVNYINSCDDMMMSLRHDLTTLTSTVSGHTKDLSDFSKDVGSLRRVIYGQKKSLKILGVQQLVMQNVNDLLAKDMEM